MWCEVQSKPFASLALDEVDEAGKILMRWD